MSQPQFSFIIPTLNEEKYLPHLLASLAQQTPGTFEVIVVDGSSKDKTVAVARSFETSFPLHIVVSKKASLPLQRNLGAKRAHGDWLVFVDADTVLLPYFLTRLSAYLTRRRPKVVATWFMPDSDVASEVMISLVGVFVLEGSLLFKRPLTPGPLTAVRKDVFVAVGGYDEQHSFNEDADFGLRLFKAGVKQHLIRETLYVWSMRRIRKQGAFRVAQQYLLGALPILLFKRPMNSMSGYVMGGQEYEKRRIKTAPPWAQVQRQWRAIVEEFMR